MTYVLTNFHISNYMNETMPKLNNKIVYVYKFNII